MIKIHIDITLKLPENGITLPIHYNYLMQAAIYKSINDELADFLHSEGYISENGFLDFFLFKIERQIQYQYRAGNNNILRPGLFQ